MLTSEWNEKLKMLSQYIKSFLWVFILFLFTYLFVRIITLFFKLTLVNPILSIIGTNLLLISVIGKLKNGPRTWADVAKHEEKDDTIFIVLSLLGGFFISIPLIADAFIK